jgi:uncharacterized membrane protein
MSEEEMDGKNGEEMESSEEEAMPEKEASGPDMDMGADDDVTQDDKLWALLAYALSPIVPIIILLMEDKKDRPFIRAHNAQALAWGLFNAVIGTILSTILFFCLGLPSIAIWLVGVYWGWQAYQGQYVTIPVVTDFVKQQGWA